MQTKNKTHDIYFAVLMLFAVITVTIRSVACLTQFDFEYGYFTGGNLASIANWITVAGCILLLTYFVSAPSVKYIATFTTPKTYVPTALVSIALVFLGGSLFEYVATNSAYPLFSAGTLTNIQYILAIASGIFAIISIYHFFLNAFIKSAASTQRAGASFLTVVFLCLYPTYLYFNKALPINSPNKIIDQMAFLFAAIFFLYESRISLGREKWRAYVSFGMVASLLCAYSSIPSIITYFATGKVISDSVAASALLFTLFIFISSRLLLIRSLAENKRAPIAEQISEYQAARREEIGDSDLITAEPEQLTFDILYGESESSEKTTDADASEEAEPPIQAPKENIPESTDSTEAALSENEEQISFEEAKDTTEL